MEVTINELEIAYKEAFSVKDENTSNMKYIGILEGVGQEVYKFWKDENGSYWYKKYYAVGENLISEEEYIFGREIKKPKRRYYSKCS